MADKPDVKSTLNLPRTDFAMKASLAQKEPEAIKKWDADRLYERILEKRAAAGRPPFILHDGPPYANGHIHLGTSMNKILKDFIVKSHSMLGHYAPYVPGWDCHGLPIEIHVDKHLGEQEEGHARHGRPRGVPQVRREVHRHPARGVQAAGRPRRLGDALSDHAPGLRGQGPRVPGRLLRARRGLQGQAARPLVHPLPDRPGRGRDRVQGQDLPLDLRPLRGRLRPGREIPGPGRAAAPTSSSGRRPPGPCRPTWPSPSTPKPSTPRPRSGATSTSWPSGSFRSSPRSSAGPRPRSWPRSPGPRSKASRPATRSPTATRSSSWPSTSRSRTARAPSTPPRATATTTT